MRHCCQPVAGGAPAIDEPTRTVTTKSRYTVGRVTPCAPFRIPVGGCGAHGVTRPTGPVATYRYLLVAVPVLAALVTAASIAAEAEAAAPNTLTKSEKAAGWRLLWDGRTTHGWHSAKAGVSLAAKWEIADGVLTVRKADDPLSAGGGNIITRERFASFELIADFKLTPGANSGIKYFVQSNLDPDNLTGAGPAVGCEFQLLDDERHPDAKLGRNGNRTVGSLYDLIPAATPKKTKPVGEWNTARILVQGKHVEHWLNGQKVLEYERGSAAFRAGVAQSKFHNIPGFGEWPTGHILLQEHGDQVHFRNIKIRALPEN